MMKAEERARISMASEQCSGVLSLFQDQLFTWANRKEKFLKPYNRDLRKMKSMAAELPEEWHNHSLGQVAAGEVFINPVRTRKFLHTHREELGKAEKQLLRYFIDQPWFYSLFSVKETLGDNLFEITDLDSGEILLLHSPGLSQFEHERIPLFLHLLFDNGACCQALGPCHYYRGYQAYDFEFLAKMVSPQLYRQSGLSAVIADKPSCFLLLDRFSETPVQVHGEEIVCLCSDSVKLDSFDPEKFAGAFNVDRRDELVRCRLKTAESPLQTAELYYDGKKRELFLLAYGLDRYRRLAGHLSGTVEIPEKPYWQATSLMLAAVRSLLDRNIPGLDYEKIFGGQEPLKPEARKEMDQINALMQEITNRQNLGIEAPLDEMAGLYNVPMETALQMQGVLTKMTEDRFQIDLEGGIDHFTPPPPVVRQKLLRPLHDSELFTLTGSEKAEDLFTDSLPGLMLLQEEPPPLSEFPRLIEKLYYQDWDIDQATILTYTAYMLIMVGDKYIRVRDYAAEILRLFWQVLLPGKDKKYRELFVERYALFCHGCLLPLGLIDLDRKIDPVEAVNGEYRIKASAFFQEWIRPGAYLRE